MSIQYFQNIYFHLAPLSSLVYLPNLPYHHGYSFPDIGSFLI